MSISTEIWREINKRRDNTKFIKEFSKAVNSFLSRQPKLKKAERELAEINRELSQLGHKTEMVHARKLATIAYIAGYKGEK